MAAIKAAVATVRQELKAAAAAIKMQPSKAGKPAQRAG